jgi:hypothetical protein
MPTTPRTIVAPVPDDPRVIALAKSLGLSRREAFGAAAEAWAWLPRQANDGIVVQAAPDSLDGLVDVAGFGAAMVDAGLVGVVDNGLVLPAELRRLERPARGSRGVVDEAERKERTKAGSRNRSQKYYWSKKDNTPAAKPSPPPAAADDSARWKPRRLGMVEGCDVMLLYSKRTGSYFYCMKGATPEEWCASVADQNSPSFGEALVGIHSTMKRGGRKGLVADVEMRPTPAQVVAAAERYRASRDAVVADAARRDEANDAFMKASIDDQEDTAERETSRQSHALAREDAKPHADLTPTAEPVPVASPCDDNGLGAIQPHAKPHADLTPTAPSSSSLLMSSSGIEEKESTTTTRRLTRPAERQRDREDDILDRLLVVSNGGLGAAATIDQDDPAKRERRQQEQQRYARIAEALGLDIDTVKIRNRDFLALQCRQAGIDPQTGFPVNADAPSKPPQARPGIDATTEPTRRDKPATGSVGARDDGELFCDHRQLRQALQAEGIPAPVAKSLTADDDAFERSGMTRATTSVACGPL